MTEVETEPEPMVEITLPDGSARRFARPVTGAEIAADIGPGLAKAALAVRVSLDGPGELRDLSRPIEGDARVEIVTVKDPEALALLRPDAAHVMAEAVTALYP